jgi:hypothetical protein
MKNVDVGACNQKIEMIVELEYAVRDHSERVVYNGQKASLNAPLNWVAGLPPAAFYLVVPKDPKVVDKPRGVGKRGRIHVPSLFGI